MKILDKISLRVRLTLFTGFILLLSCILFSLVSIKSAKDTYVFPEDFFVKNGDVSGNSPPLITDSEVELKLIKDNQDDEFTLKNSIIAILIVSIGAAATYFIIGKAMRPVVTLSRDIKKIDSNNLSYRVSVPSSKDEVADLAHSFNSMINRVEKAYITQKNFSANAAHELRTPLAGIIASIEVLFMSETFNEVECREALNDCLQNTERLNDLINDLLEMDGVVSPDSCEMFYIADIAENILHELSEDIENKQLHIINNGLNLQVFGDKGLFHRMLFNLCHNAVKYNEDNGNLTISAYEDENEICICIENTGREIPPEDIPKIFEPFYCVDKSRSRELGGKGLGLSIVKTIVDKCGGTIGVACDDDKIIFTVKLPKIKKDNNFNIS